MFWKKVDSGQRNEAKDPSEYMENVDWKTLGHTDLSLTQNVTMVGDPTFKYVKTD